MTNSKVYTLPPLPGNIDALDLHAPVEDHSGTADI